MVKKNSQRILSALSKVRLHQHVYLSLVAILIGFLGGYGALIFRYAIKFAQYAFYGNTSDVLTFFPDLPISLTCQRAFMEIPLTVASKSSGS